MPTNSATQIRKTNPSIGSAIQLARGKTVGVRYVSVGIQSRDNETEAMQLLAKHCGGRGYQVTNRTVSGQPTRVTIDAVCL
jgi:hypothetical protein